MHWHRYRCRSLHMSPITLLVSLPVLSYWEAKIKSLDNRYLIWIGTHGNHVQYSWTWFCFSQGSDQEKTFGPTISGLIHKHIGPERLLLWDSKTRGGRPDSIKILKETYTAWNAEGKSSLIPSFRCFDTDFPIVVFITSNYTGNTEMMQGCKENNIPCFGTLWDFVRVAYF